MMEQVVDRHVERRESFRRILGIEFFCGTAQEAIVAMRHGGLLVAPAAPALKELSTDPDYRESLLNADLVIADSAYMVMIWNVLEADHVHRLSGLEYLRELLMEADVRAAKNTLWIMSSVTSAKRHLKWLADQGIQVPDENVYMAPLYGREIEDNTLIERLNRLKPRHVVVTVGGGTQERLGLYVKRNVHYRPSIHCIGAAIAFLSGDQVLIPVWADQLYLGWLYRCVSDPKRYVPRYWAARKLLQLIVRFRSHLPPLLV